MSADGAKALQSAGADSVYLGGHPVDARAAYGGAGIDEFIFFGADVLTICGTALDHLLAKQGEK